MIKLATIFGMVSIAAAAVAPTTPSTTTLATPTPIPCTSQEECTEKGFFDCFANVCIKKKCKTDEECQKYEETKPFCSPVGFCSDDQCNMDIDCKKYNLSSCVKNKCVGPPVAEPSTTSIATATATAKAPLDLGAPKKVTQCISDRDCTGFKYRNIYGSYGHCHG